MNNSMFTIGKHLAIFVFIFTGLLVWIYSGSGREKMGDFYRTHGNYWLSDFIHGGEVKMKKDTNTKDEFDTMIIITSKKQKRDARAKAIKEGKTQAQFHPVNFPIDSWANSCLFFVFFIALMFAAPTSLKRKIVGLIFGLPIVYLFIYFKIWLCILFRFSQYYDTFEVGFSSKTMLSIMNHIYNIVMFPYFGLMITLLVCLSFVFFGNNENIGTIKEAKTSIPAAI